MITTSEFERQYGISSRTLRQKIANKEIPAEVRQGPKGKKTYYIDPDVCLPRLGLASSDDDTDWGSERIKYDALIKQKRDAILGIELAELKGSMHRAEFVEDAMNRLIFAERAHVMALPGKLAPILAAENDEAVIAGILKDEFRAMQEDLAQYAYDPKFFQDRLAEVRGKESSDAD